MSNKTLIDLPSWQALKAHQESLSSTTIKALFDDDPKRFSVHHIEIDGLLFDFSKHAITEETVSNLCALARARNVESRRDRMVNGETINESESRAVLHMALRGSCADEVTIDGENVCAFVSDTLSQIKTLSKKIRENQKITDVVNIGIGGSDLGPRMAYKGLKPFADGPNIYFISNVDASGLDQRLKSLNPESTLFIIASKTFSTQETMENAKAAKDWLLESLDESTLAEHLIATTTNIEAAENFGVVPENILPLRDWVGGRYSVWGAIGLPLAIAIGFERFQKFLDGAKAMDTHFLNAPLEKNAPVLMAMLGVWYRNFWDRSAHAVLPYSHDLRDFPIYMQQLDMESNGKAIAQDGHDVGVETGPVVFGEAGTNCQHTFMQLLHQSAEIIPADFIVFANPSHTYFSHHEKLLGNALAQSKALMEGRENTQEPHRNFSGNRPSSTLVFDRLDAYHLGMLLALYEHKIFVQGVIWGINSFDQWGVELGKTLAQKTTKAIENKGENESFDTSTAGLCNHLAKKFIKS